MNKLPKKAHEFHYSLCINFFNEINKIKEKNSLLVSDKCYREKMLVVEIEKRSLKNRIFYLKSCKFINCE